MAASAVIMAVSMAPGYAATSGLNSSCEDAPYPKVQGTDIVRMRRYSRLLRVFDQRGTARWSPARVKHEPAHRATTGVERLGFPSSVTTRSNDLSQRDRAKDLWRRSWHIAHRYR
jgi:hypothetical protein